MRTVLNNETETACVPGPTTDPIDEFPALPILFAGIAKAAAFTQLPMPCVCGCQLAPGTISALPAPSRFGKLVPIGSAPEAVTVRYGPLWNSTTPAACQPPAIPSSQRFAPPSSAFPLPTGRSYTKVE